MRRPIRPSVAIRLAGLLVVACLGGCATAEKAAYVRHLTTVVPADPDTVTTDLPADDQPALGARR